jgi:hypothetical protein
MEPEFPIFKPRYPLKARLTILVPSALFFATMCLAAISAASFPVLLWLLLLAGGLFTSLMPFFVIREVRFLEEMVVRRHFLPDRFFAHNELENIDPDSIRAGGQRIRMGRIANLDELKEMSRRWKAARILKETQAARPKKESFYFQRGYGSYASFWGLIFSIIVMMLLPARMQTDLRWVLGGTFLVVYYLYIYIVPKYL